MAPNCDCITGSREHMQPSSTFVAVMSLFSFPSITCTDCCHYVTLQTRGAELLHPLPSKNRQISGGRAEKPQPELHHHPADDQPRPVAGAWVHFCLMSCNDLIVVRVADFNMRLENLCLYSCEWGVAPAGRAQTAAADRAPPVGEPARG